METNYQLDALEYFIQGLENVEGDVADYYVVAIESIKKNMKDEKATIKNKELETNFNEFWSLYPKKVGKANAKKSFMKIKPNDDLFMLIINALELQKNSRQWKDIQYIPHASTWLNSARWEDEVYVSDKIEMKSSNPYLDMLKKGEF